MATYSLRSKRGLDGRPARPVARVRVTTPFPQDAGGDVVQRYTLRSDGVVLYAAQLWDGWSQPSVWAPAPSTPMTLDEAIGRFPTAMRRYILKRHADATIIDEEV